MKGFTFQDQRWFALFSGDFNPLHLDPARARRELFGEVVVHGLHTVIAGLEAIAAEGPERIVSAIAIEAQFRKPVYLDRPVEYTVSVRGEGTVVEVSQEGSVRTQVRMEGGGPWEGGARGLAVAGGRSPAGGGTPEPEPRGWEEIKGAEGEVPLILDRDLLREAFPAMADHAPEDLVATLLALTRLVGMVCPGERSLFSSFRLERLERGGGAVSRQSGLTWKVTRAQPRVSFMEMAVGGAGWSGSVQAFVRPTAVAQPSFAEVRESVGPSDFAGEGAFVIGGSRGAGETTAKILAAGGADVLLTYHRGAEDAERVVSEIRGGGGRCSAAMLNVLDRPSLAGFDMPSGSRLGLYYFASPLIRPSETPELSRDLLDRFLDFYVRGVETLYRAVRERHDGPLLLFYPSSVYVEKPPAGFREYGAAKAAGESVCQGLKASDDQLEVRAPRLPPMATDQTLAIIPRDVDRPLDILLPLLRDPEGIFDHSAAQDTSRPEFRAV